MKLTTKFAYAALILCLSVNVFQVSGHGRLIDPPSRNSAWRFGHGTPPDYDDHGNSVWCGGRWGSNEGRSCGICGDPPNGHKNNEVGGKFFTGKVVKSYNEGATIDVRVEVTAAHHKSWWEFKVCPATNNHQEVSQGCLDSNTLDIEHRGRRYDMPFQSGVHHLRVRLPNGMKCDRCVLQWTWHSEGTNEIYRACSDIKIGHGGTSGGHGGGNVGHCLAHDGACTGDHGSQADCCGGLYCHKTIPSWRHGRCYYRSYFFSGQTQVPRDMGFMNIHNYTHMMDNSLEPDDEEF